MCCHLTCCYTLMDTAKELLDGMESSAAAGAAGDTGDAGDGDA